MKIRLLELFGGIGACSKALERIGIDYEIADYVEIDKYAVKSFNAIHNTNFEPQDITKWDKDIEVDLIMHGSPCQDFSLAGLQAGGDEGSGTRSSLMYETVRIVKKLKPQYVIWENVPNVLSKKHIHNFQNYIQFLDNLGYKSAYEVLNAKDYGIPQNRERLFVVSVLDGRTRDLLGLELDYTFPKPIPLKLKLKDVLEDEVDKKYYLSEKAIQGRLITNYQKYKLEENIIDKEVHPTILARFDGAPTLVVDNSTFIGRKYDEFIEKKGYIPEMFNPYNNTKIKNIAPTQTTQCGSTASSATILIKEKVTNTNIRKLTPKECWRLMGFDDEDVDKASEVNSNTQLYKQAGNSIVINVLETIFKELFKL
jgi:DNA (cytosine-5)-methyltransferase 1